MAVSALFDSLGSSFSSKYQKLIDHEPAKMGKYKVSAITYANPDNKAI